MIIKNSLIFVLFSLCLLSELMIGKESNGAGTVIILNGPAAVGKSSIIRSLQSKTDEVWLCLGIDNLFMMALPVKFYLEDKPEHKVVMYGEFLKKDNEQVFKLYFGPEGQKVIAGMHNAIAAYARAGNNVIVDYIAYYPEWHDNFMDALKGIPVIAVGITADLSVIEEREKSRATSPVGHARSVYTTVHNGWNYDLFINTDLLTPNQVADQIIAEVCLKKVEQV